MIAPGVKIATSRLEYSVCSSREASNTMVAEKGLETLTSTVLYKICFIWV